MIKRKIKTLIKNPIGVYNKYSKNFVRSSDNKPKAKAKNCISLSSEFTDDSLVYIPWIKSHGDRMIEIISEKSEVKFTPLWINESIHDPAIRRNINRFSREEPDTFRKHILSYLAPRRSKIKAVVFSMDWNSTMRIICSACKELEIKTILIPHEGVFADRNEYYKDQATKTNVPISDFIMCWGDLHRDIFIERGYPEERITPVGSVKLSNYFDYEPEIPRNIFFKIYGLDENIKTILYACQPLDSQFDMSKARESQNNAISDLARYCINNSIQLIIRLPPSNDAILDSDNRNTILSSPLIVTDGLPYLTSPEESIMHTDLVMSVNSTMLFESLLLDKPAISTKYVEFDQIWDEVNIPTCKNEVEMNKLVSIALLTPNEILRGIDFNRAEYLFSNGGFGSQTIDNIVKFLSDELDFSIYEPSESLLDIGGNPHKKLNISLNNDLTESNVYVSDMLDAQSVYCATTNLDLIKTDVFINWGISENIKKKKQIINARKLGKKLFIIEDGFLRSLNIGLSKEPGLSILLDTKTAYYDSTRPSLMEDILNSNRLFEDFELTRARQCIDDIVDYKLSKYNHVHYKKINIGTRDKKILIVDQRYGDASIVYGQGSSESFEKMLKDAMTLYPEYDVIIKRHPDATIGGKGSHYDDSHLDLVKKSDRLHLVDYEVNPHSLFEIVDKVFCVTSGMGFEALMAGKEVHTYALPFYSNWGLTKDTINLDRRCRARSIEELFYVSYILLSRYYDPVKHEKTEIESVINYLHFEMNKVKGEG